MKRLAILGSTGSVGEQTLEISMLDRSLPTKTKFRRATAEELESAVSDYR